MNRNKTRSTVPDGLPTLHRGRHRNPLTGACLMEYVSVLAGHPRQTDQPSCTHPVLAALAREINDRILDDRVRAGLAVLAPRLIGTDVDDRRLAPLLTLVCLKAAADAGAGGPEMQYRVWRARTALRRADSRPGRAGRPRPKLSDTLRLDGAIRSGWKQLAGLKDATRDRWLADLLTASVDVVDRLLGSRPGAPVRPATPTRRNAVTPRGLEPAAAVPAPRGTYIPAGRPASSR